MTTATTKRCLDNVRFRTIFALPNDEDGPTCTCLGRLRNISVEREMKYSHSERETFSTELTVKKNNFTARRLMDVLWIDPLQLVSRFGKCLNNGGSYVED
ncbi:hypothetical protein TNCV_51991 [Trichonephila clavipes]|nr:hypothetical protein TNCV_51991 [Trichonephila clavipes]